MIGVSEFEPSHFPLVARMRIQVLTTVASSEHRADEELEPVRVPVGVDHALGRHAEDEGAERRADGRAVAAGQEAAAHHRGGDVEKLVADARAGLHRVVGEEQVHRQEPAAEADRHEEPDLHPLHRHADRPGAVALAADGEDPVADLGAQKHPGGERDEEQPVDDGDADLRSADHEVGGEDRLERVRSQPSR